MKNAKEKFADLARIMGQPSTEDVADPPIDPPTQIESSTATQKAVKTTKPRQRPPLALRRASSNRPEVEHAPSPGDAAAAEEPRRQMTVKLPVSLYTRLSNEKSRRVVGRVQNWSIQDIITEALDNFLRAR